MRCSVMIEPDGGQPYALVRALARHAEARGFARFLCSDHYEPAFEWFAHGAPDSWTLLAALAADTRHIGLGTLITPVTLRRLSTLAKAVTTVAAIADGPGERRTAGSRVHLGLGAGWLQSEHEHYGLSFGPPRERFDRLAEHLEALRRLFDLQEHRTTFVGDHVTVREAPFAPKPDPRPWIVLGGRGRVRMPQLAAVYADELNVPFLPLDQLAGHRALLDEACRNIGREPASIVLSAKRGVLTGRTASDVRDRAARMRDLAADDRSVDDYLAWLSERWIVGTGSQIVEQVKELQDAGVEHLVLQHLLPDDLDMLDVVAEHIEV